MTRTPVAECVKLKDAIHAALSREYRGLSDAEISRRMLRKLLDSDSPIARLWRAAPAGPRSRSKATRRRRKSA